MAHHLPLRYLANLGHNTPILHNGTLFSTSKNKKTNDVGHKGLNLCLSKKRDLNKTRFGRETKTKIHNILGTKNIFNLKIKNENMKNYK